MKHEKISPSSWIYRWVWQTPKILRFATILVLILFLITYLFLAAINPRLPGNFGWNTIDHVSDRRPRYDYTQAQFTAMAGSKHWLALGTTGQGLTLLNKASRILREHLTKGRVLDVTTGIGEDEFLALQGDQAIIALNMSKNAQNIWLPKPTNPMWRGNFVQGQDINIVNNVLDEHGWLVVVKDHGVARYLFGKLSSGELYRKRSWQTGTLSNVPLKDAWITDKGIWITLENGGIRFAGRTSLNEVSRRRIETPPIQRLESDYSGQWASAIDNNNSLWLYSENTGWAGPFFGSDTRCQLESLSDITVAALHDEQVAWFGSDNGLFAYDLKARRIHCVVPDITVENIIPLKMSETSSQITTLVTSNQGIKRVNSSNTNNTLRDFNTENLDSAPIISASLSPDANLFVYQRQIVNEGENAASINAPQENEVGVLESPLDGNPMTIIPRKGWQHLDSAPRIVGVENRENDWLFATSNGAFLYNPDNHTYTDVSDSKSLRKNERNEITRIEEELQNFTDLKQGRGGFTALADNKIILLQSDSNQWINLDPFEETHPTQLAHTKDGIFGLGPRGQIYRYEIPSSSYSPPDITSYLTGNVQTLQKRPSAQRGELFQRTDGSWRIDFIHGNNLVNYDSATGKIQQQPIPNELRGNRLSQVRLIEDNQSYIQEEKLLYLHSNGRILEIVGEENNLRTIFGSGSLPFAPENITAIAPSRGINEVLLGSSSGQVVKYSWLFGSWRNVTQQPIPESGNAAIIVELQDTRYGIFVRTANNSLFRLNNETWERLDRNYWRWATTNSQGSDIWAVGTNGIARFLTKSGFKLGFSSGTGMSAFVAKAIFAWQLDDTTVVFFSQGPEIGIYNTRTDTWKEQYFTEIRDPHQFIITHNGELIVLDSHRIVRIDKELNTHTIVTLPFSAKNPTIHWDGKSLQAAFINNHQAMVLRVWNKLEDNHNNKYDEYQGGGLTAGHFDPTQVVYAQEYKDSSVLLIDKRGEIALYNYTTSQWRILRKAIPGQTIHSLLPARTGDNTVRLLLETERQTTSEQQTTTGIDTVFDNRSEEPETEPQINTVQRVTIIVTISEDKVSQKYEVQMPADTFLEQREVMFPITSIMYRFISFLKQEKWTPIFLTQARDKTLLDTQAIRIIRENEQTHYQLLTYGQWHSLHPQRGGFSEDKFQDTALSSSGKLWALQSNRVVNIVSIKETKELVVGQESLALTKKPISMANLITGHIRLHYRNGDSEVFQDSQFTQLEKSVIATKHLATMNFAGHRLDWTWQPNGTINATWQYVQLPVWEQGSGGKLAIQAVQDIALTNDNKLLIASELGLQVRNSDYVLKKLYPELRGNISFVHMYGPERILVKRDNHFAYEWKKGKLISLPSKYSEQVVNRVKSGPWNWQLQYPTRERIAVFHHKNNEISRVWVTEDHNQWRFQDDIVNWIIRKPSGELWLETPDGVWLFDINQGRSSDTSKLITVMPHENFEIRNDAIRISYSGNEGMISFHASDNNSIFEQGRFFFDNGKQMCAYKNEIYILVQNRGIIRRDSKKIGKITGFWPLPLNQQNVRYSLKCSKDGVQLKKNLPKNNRRAWVLNSDNTDVPWQESKVTDVRTRAEFGPITLRVHNARIKPFLKRAQTFTRLRNWWHGDRFVWDKAICVGALNHNVAVLITPIGVVALQRANDGTFPMVDIKPNSLQNDINYCTDARTNDGRHIGLIASNASGSHQYLITTDLSGTSAIKVQHINSSHLYRTVLKISYKEPHYIGISQIWENYVPSNVRNPTFIVELPHFSANNLLWNGQFILDQAYGASPIMSDTDMWAIFPDCHQHQCVIGVNQIERGTDQTRLVLRDIWLPAFSNNFQALKPSPEGGLFELYQNDVIEIRKRQPIIGNPVWDKVYPHEAQVQEAFYRGERITINIASNSWESQPLYQWDSSPRLTVTPHAYRLFSHQHDGVLLSFDVISSLALNKKTQTLAVGTRGGVFIFPYINHGKQIVKINNPSSNAYDLRYEIERVRYDITAGELHRKLKNVGSTEDWFANYANVPKYGVNIDTFGFENNGKRYEMSNDAWGIGRKPLSHLVDFVFDDKSKTLWLGTQRNGVFKVWLR